MTRKVLFPRRFYIAPTKINGYLLDADHPDGGPKCAFLESFGFTPELAGSLHHALNMHRVRENYRGWIEGYRAVKHYYEGELISPGMENPRVRTVWQVDDDDVTNTARFITLKPLPKLKVMLPPA